MISLGDCKLFANVLEGLMCIMFFIALERKSAVETLPARLPFVSKEERVVKNRAQLKKLETKIYESYGDDER